MTQYTIGGITFAPAPRISVRQLVDDQNSTSGKSLRDVPATEAAQQAYIYNVARIIEPWASAYTTAFKDAYAKAEKIAALSKGVA